MKIVFIVATVFVVLILVMPFFVTLMAIASNVIDYIKEETE